MIISVSRRTDIPALYGDWLLNRIREGYALVRNPMNRHQVGRVRLTPEAVDAFVFWTKNPRPFLHAVPQLEAYPSYYQVTLTPYGPEVEQNLPDKEMLTDTFIQLSKLVGAHRVVWRYDPILFTDQYTAEFHVQAFTKLIQQLHPYTEKVVISFLDEYAKTKRNTKDLGILSPNLEERRELASRLAEISRRHGLRIEACTEPEDYNNCGVAPGSCIDPQMLFRILGREISAHSDKNQRTGCHCLPSIDLGAYNTCTHQCLYCYANASLGVALANRAAHDPTSPFLLGIHEEGDRITDRK
ncbi:DUF1848 domain-containing protein [Gorillibacterium timonense]|uniref:DUF1848 domain-containing protein n=1 Tax=Gorillibacterium timonense TaxID=1689269 RepID=UPI00071DD0A4|nr:DUF1848 domain-containing protein [Gorillibacterium timonense]